MDISHTYPIVDTAEELEQLNLHPKLPTALQHALLGYDLLNQAEQAALLGAVLEEFEDLNRVKLDGKAIKVWGKMEHTYRSQTAADKRAELITQLAS